MSEMKDFFTSMAEKKYEPLSEAELDLVAGGKNEQGLVGMIEDTQLAIGSWMFNNINNITCEEGWNSGSTNRGMGR